MKDSSRTAYSSMLIISGIILLTLLSTIVLKSIAPEIYPTYYVYLVLTVLVFYVFLKIDFEVFLAFSPHFYVASIVLLVLPIVIGQVTRGAIRWIPIGSITIQPSEIVRPFLLLFCAKYLTECKPDLRRLVKLFAFILLPFLLILTQPSFGVAILTTLGFFGVLLASSIEKKYILVGIGIIVLVLPILWLALRPYQRQRITTFLDPTSDPHGTGYNSIQSMIAVGSGKIFGRGLGEGIQTQLAFLPEKHTDFIFAAIAEEMGFAAAVLTILGLMAVFWSLIIIIEKARGPAARAYVAGVFLILFSETLIHAGMNMGLLPITGIPLPFVSAGGSALLGTAMSVAIAVKAKK